MDQVVNDIWTTRDGRKIRVCEMDDNHLVNTIRFLERRAEMIRVKYLSSYFFVNTMSDAVQDALDAEQTMIENMSPEEIIRNFETMELKREPYTANILKLMMIEAGKRELYNYEEEELRRGIFGVRFLGLILPNPKEMKKHE